MSETSRDDDSFTVWALDTMKQNRRAIWRITRLVSILAGCLCLIGGGAVLLFKSVIPLEAKFLVCGVILLIFGLLVCSAVLDLM